MTTSNAALTEPTAPQEEAGFDLLDGLMILARRWRLLAGLTVLFGVLMYAGAHLLQPRYLASVSFLVDLDIGNNGTISFFRATDPTVTLLTSKSISEIVVQKATMQALQRGNALPKEALEGLVQGEVAIGKGSDGVYVLSVLDPYPDRAVLIANTYIDALQELGDRMQFETAARSRSYFESQTAQERQELEKAEAALKTTQERTGLLQPGSQTGMEIGQIAGMRNQIMALQVQRATMGQSVTAENPEMIRLNTQISELQSRMNALQTRINTESGTGLASENLELVRLGREVAYHEGLMNSMAAQYERARQQEHYDAPRVRVIDRAALPLPKTYPRPLALAGFAGGTGFLLGLFLILFEQILRRLHRDPVSSAKLHALGRTLRGRA